MTYILFAYVWTRSYYILFGIETSYFQPMYIVINCHQGWTILYSLNQGHNQPIAANLSTTTYIQQLKFILRASLRSKQVTSHMLLLWSPYVLLLAYNPAKSFNSGLLSLNCGNYFWYTFTSLLQTNHFIASYIFLEARLCPHVLGEMEPLLEIA